MTQTQKTQRNQQQAQQFENIKLGKFQNIDSYKEVSRGIVLATRVESCVISLNQFSIAQLLEGAKVYVGCPGDIVARIGLLMFLDENGRSTVFSREDVQNMRGMIEARIAHCEKERDERSDKFNPDTYIGLKFLLLDIREWLMIDAIGEFKPEVEPVCTSAEEQIISNVRADRQADQQHIEEMKDIYPAFFDDVYAKMHDYRDGSMTEQGIANFLEWLKSECMNRNIIFRACKRYFGIVQ